MPIEPCVVRTSVASLKRISPDHLEVSYFPGAVLDPITLGEVQQARRELMGDTPYCMLSLLPEDVDYTTSAMNMDHLSSDREEGSFLAIALVAHANIMEMILKLYFSYYPQLNRIHVTPSEADAREWLEKQMEELGRNGN